VTDAVAQLRTATRRAKSDVANKLVSMFLHELSRKVIGASLRRVDSEEYGALVRQHFEDQCPYCARPLADNQSVVEHLDGMNRYRIGLHIPGNVLVACRKCNGEKRRDDSLKVLVLANSGWASFLSHDGTRCAPACLTCRYWGSLWPNQSDRSLHLRENLNRILAFRSHFPELELINRSLASALPAHLPKLYSDCQTFAEREIRALLEQYSKVEAAERAR
jgi:hypothetical protein